MSSGNDNGSIDDGLVWLTDDSRAYIKGHIIKFINNDTQALVRADGSQEDIIIEASKIERCNPPQFDRCDDMASLTYLNEPSVVNNLMLRYEQDNIYTYSGLFLVAINPYKQLNIYSNSFIDMYKNSTVSSKDDGDSQRLNSIKPHIFATSEEAFQNLIKDKKDQSILVTGESGAGKTENTKKVIQYLISVASSNLNKSTSVNFENQILEANPILESFGNAQTVRNLNSSRFGKFVKVRIQPSTKQLCGAHIDWYLLEKSRVVLQDSRERNYHIFYQLLRGSTDGQLDKFKLNRSVYNYGYLKDTNHSVEGIDDRTEFSHLNKALDVFSFSTKEKEQIFKVIAIVLHLGNITFTNSDNNTRQASLSQDSPTSTIAELFGISENDFKNSFLTSKVKAGREVVTQQRTAAQAKFTIDALSKSLYERLFQYLIDKINENFDRSSIQSLEQSSFIGILDIAGFEIFDKNSFEQLCINYTNEKLQQFFNHNMFILEQNEYLKEGISWDYIDFGQELKPTIELIEGSATKRVGIFSILDEECVVPKGSDSSYLEKLHRELEIKDKKIDQAKIRYKPNKLRDGFLIKHYAGEVNYSIDGWLEKNKDPLSNTIVELLSESKDIFIQELFSSDNSMPANLTDSPVKGGSKRRSGMFRTVAQRHKEQLNNLMNQLGNTQPHFVRCILPNTQKQPREFNKTLVLEQLRCNGVLEGIRIARSGYPNRIDFQYFVDHYGILGKSSVSQKRSGRNAKQICELLLSELNLDANVYKVGLTKLFFRNGVLAVLEKDKDRKIAKIVTQFNAIVRGKLIRDQLKQKLAKSRASQVILKNFEKYDELHKDPWFKLISTLKPMLVDSDSTQSYYMQKIKELEKEVDDLKIENQAAIESNSRIEKELETSKADTATDRKLIDEKDSRLEAAQLKQVSLEKELEETKCKLNEIQEIQEIDKSSANTEKALLEKQLETLNVQSTSASEESKLLQDEINLLKACVSKKDEHISAIESKLESGTKELMDKLSNANSELERIKTELDSVMAENNDLKNSLTKAKTSANEFSKTIKAKEAELSLLKKQADEDKEKMNSFFSLKKELSDKNSLASSEAKLRTDLEKLKARYKQLKHEAKETRELLDAKISDEISFERGKQQFDKEVNNLKSTIEGLSQEIHLERKTSSELRQSLKSVKLENDQLAKAKKAFDVKMAEVNLKLSQRPDSQASSSDARKLLGEMEMLQTRLASEAYENRQLRAHLRKLNGGSVSGGAENMSISDFSPASSRSAVSQSELEIEKAANKRLEKLNIELQKELLQYKNNARDARGLAPVEADFKTKYQLAELQLKNLEDRLRQSTSASSASPLQDATARHNNATNISNPFIDKDSIMAKQENLRLNSLLNESQTKLKRMQTSNNSSFVQEEQLVQLRTKLQVINNKNLSLQESVEFYKTRAESYYSKIEAAEVAVQTAKRAEEMVRNELNQTKQRLANAQKEFTNSDIAAAGLSSTIRELERDLSDRTFELRRLQEAYDLMKEKYENEDELRASTSSSQSESKDRELKMLSDELVQLMNKETELNKQIKNITIQLDTTKRETRSLKFSNGELVKEKDQFKRLLAETMEKNSNMLTERQEHLLRLNTLESQVMTLKTTNEDLIKERDSLLDSKRALEMKVADISVEFDKHLAKAKDDANNAVTVVQLSKQLKESSNYALNLKSKLEEYDAKVQEFESQIEQLNGESMIIIEENKSLTKFNIQLKNKLEEMETKHQIERDADSKHWSNRVHELEEKIFLHNATARGEDQKIYNLERSVKDLSKRNEIHVSTIQRYQDEIKNLEETVSRLDSSLVSMQAKEAEAVLNAKRAARELNDFKEQSLLMEKELLDWKTNSIIE